MNKKTYSKWVYISVKMVLMKTKSVPSKDLLRDLYLQHRLSSAEIAQKLLCSETKVNYWLSRYGIQKRSISEAVYQRANPKGNPFRSKPIKSLEDAFIFGLGLGLYWGEGNKKDPSSVRLGNSDPELVKAFLYFLEDRFATDRRRLRFGLQLFSDMDTKAAERFWSRHLGVSAKSFYKTVITPSGKIGSYREKTKYGVMTLYFHNSRLKRLLLEQIDNLQGIDYSSLVLPMEEKPM